MISEAHFHILPVVDMATKCSTSPLIRSAEPLNHVPRPFPVMHERNPLKSDAVDSTTFSVMESQTKVGCFLRLPPSFVRVFAFSKYFPITLGAWKTSLCHEEDGGWHTEIEERGIAVAGQTFIFNEDLKFFSLFMCSFCLSLSLIETRFVRKFHTTKTFSSSSFLVK